MRTDPSLSILVPIYNGGRLAEKACLDLFESLRDIPRIEILFGNDGSTDDSLDRLALVAESQPRVRVFSHENRGLGYTLNELIREAQAELCVYVDVDLSFDVAYLAGLAREARNCDIVVASRYCGTSPRGLPASRRLSSWLYRFAARVVFGVPVRDIGSGMVVFRRDRVRALGLRSSGFDWHLELYHEAGRRNYRIAETPVPYRHGDRGSFRLWRHAWPLIARFLAYSIARGGRTQRG